MSETALMTLQECRALIAKHAKLCWDQGNIRGSDALTDVLDEFDLITHGQRLPPPLEEDAMKLDDIHALAATLESKKLPSEDGTDYVTRYTVRKTDAGSVYLQHLHRADRDPALHTHPWTYMRTTVLHGGYEQRWGRILNTGLGPEGVWRFAAYEPLKLRAGAAYTMDQHDAHRIEAVQPDTWSLLVVGPKRDDWGFFVEGFGFIPWRERFRERGVQA